MCVGEDGGGGVLDKMGGRGHPSHLESVGHVGGLEGGGVAERGEEKRGNVERGGIGVRKHVLAIKGHL